MSAAERGAAAPAPILSLRGVELRFVQPVDLAGRIANLLGAGLKTQVVHAVGGVDLEVQRGEVIGIVGESGCGKSTLGRIVSGILPPSAGDVHYHGKAVKAMTGTERRAYELGVQMIFQDPYASLNPRMRVREIIGEAPVAHGLIRARDKAEYVAGLMRQVGLDPTFAQRYPHQFSGAASAHRHRSRPGAEAVGDRLRRGRGRVGRVHTSPGIEFVRAAAR